MATATPEAPAGILEECRLQVEQQCGSGAVWEPVTDRFGCMVWRVSGPRGVCAVKVGREDGAAVVARESVVMERLGGLVPATSYGKRAQWGRATTTAWLVTPWLDGPSTWEVFRPVRDGRREARVHALRAAADVCAAVGALHQAGWVHGDVQPHHVIHTRSGACLVDCSWAWHMTMPPSYGFGGGLVHLMSPELMVRAEKGLRPLVTTQPDEVYSLAAGLWWAASNRWPVDYRAVGIDPATLTPIVLRRMRLERRVPFGEMCDWPELGEALKQVIEVREDRRPSALQLGQWLMSLM
ncbi:hypothetical protein [Streptomyces albogriseolus]|uniref:hypothetical protein n=1 Tax=Streptomyces albogriseolus TaxID=1887 RepID=UPI00346052F5